VDSLALNELGVSRIKDSRATCSSAEYPRKPCSRPATFFYGTFSVGVGASTSIKSSLSHFKEDWPLEELCTLGSRGRMALMVQLSLVCSVPTKAAGFNTTYDAPFKIPSIAVGVPALLPARLLLALPVLLRDELLIDELIGIGENMI
jgi:hypothetical protein